MFVICACVGDAGRNLYLLKLRQRKPKLRRKQRRGRMRTSPNVLPLRSLSSCMAVVCVFAFLWCFIEGLMLIMWFVIFRDDFRKEFKEAHPDSKDVKVVWIIYDYMDMMSMKVVT